MEKIKKRCITDPGPPMVVLREYPRGKRHAKPLVLLRLSSAVLSALGRRPGNPMGRVELWWDKDRRELGISPTQEPSGWAVSQSGSVTVMGLMTQANLCLVERVARAKKVELNDKGQVVVNFGDGVMEVEG